MALGPEFFVNTWQKYNSRRDVKRTHCDRRPSCEIVSRTLSAKLVYETCVGVPLTVPFANFEGAGKGSSRTSVGADDAIMGWVIGP